MARAAQGERPLQLNPSLGDMTMNFEDAKLLVFARYGMAAHDANCFEVYLVNAIFGLRLLADPSLSPEQVDRVEAKLSKHTIGQLIDRVRKELDVEPELLDRLQDRWKSRNYLVHSFFWDHSDDLQTGAGLVRMGRKLDELQSAMRDASAIAHLLTRRVHEKMGISETELKAFVDAGRAELVDE